jgi:hypothetical protein
MVTNQINIPVWVLHPSSPNEGYAKFNFYDDAKFNLKTFWKYCVASFVVIIFSTNGLLGFFVNSIGKIK